MSEKINPLSIVVCTRNRSASLQRLLQSLCAMDVPSHVDWEVLIVNNASEDDTDSLVSSFDTLLPLTTIHESAVGLSHARNAALKGLRGRNIIWTDDDVTVSREWLSVYERAFRYWPDKAFFGGPVRARFEGEPQAWVAIALETNPEMFAHIDPTSDFVDLGVDGDFLPFGANMGVRAEFIGDIRFDTRYGRQPGEILVGGEEIQFLQRVVARGGEGVWLPPAIVYHWIDAQRQTPRRLYDFAFGEAFAEEALDPSVASENAFARVPEGAVDDAFARRGSVIPANGVDGGEWIRELKESAAVDGRRLAWSLLPRHFRHRPARSGRRVLALGLDGFEWSVAERMIAEGGLRRIDALRGRSACFSLDHGEAIYTGLAWEHFSTGHAPDDYGRFSAVEFDPRSYRAVQEPTRHAPFAEHLNAHTVVFDVPYFDLQRVRCGSGITNWGAHDPGVGHLSRPDSLVTEVLRRFGRYPATPWIYGFTWPDPAATEEMGAALTRAMDQRTEISRWLLTERFPQWDLALVTASELHSSIEPFWHGIDAAHPLHHAPSAPAARRGLEAIYEATDRLVGSLSELEPDMDVVVFSMHGMGPNRADIPGMLLLPELLFRYAFGVDAWTPDPLWENAGEVPVIKPGEDWRRAVTARVSVPECCRDDRVQAKLDDAGVHMRADSEMAWMPAAAYRAAWPLMNAFALPSFYDGRIRINLCGREARGRVSLQRYERFCDDLVRLIEQCRDIRTGEPIVENIRRYQGDPMTLADSNADIVVRWRGVCNGLVHPRLGTIGPVPYRRTGGHQGPGVAWVSGEGIEAGDYGIASSFDVVPTILDLLALSDRPHTSGALLPFARAARRSVV